jgi:sugar O-acyltransferase (sialic acid O-acetyltransferase NeuD family)
MRTDESTLFHIIGNGGHANSVADAISTQYANPDIKFFSHGSLDSEDRCIEHLNYITELGSKCILVLGVGIPEFRIQMLGNLMAVFPRELFRPIIHAKAYVSPRSIIGWGSVILANSYVGPSVELSDFCLVNTGAIVEHDSKIGFNVSVGPSAVLAGKTIIGKNSSLGMNSSVIQNIELGDSCTVGANTFVNRAFPAGSRIVGNPAKEVE